MVRPPEFFNSRNQGSLFASFIFAAFLILNCLAFSPAPAFANDGVASVRGQTIAPIIGEDKNVRLVREELNIYFSNDGFAYVDVTFYLKNESPGKVAVWAGFPDERKTLHDALHAELKADGLTEDQIEEDILTVWAGYAGWIEDFTAEVNGEPIEWQDRFQTVHYNEENVRQMLSDYWDGKPVKGEFPYNLGPEFAQMHYRSEGDLSVVWKSFQLVFEGGEEKTVRHTYRAARGGGIGFAPHLITYFAYTLLTGRSWKGVNDEIVITATLDPELDCEWIIGDPTDEWPLFDYEREPENLEFYEGLMLTTPWMERVDGRTLRGVRRNWEPSTSDTPVLDLCAWEEMYYWMDDGIFPESSTRLLTHEEIAAAPLGLLKAGVWEILARNGRPFPEDHPFYWWIFERDGYVPDETYAVPEDDDARLSDVERENVRRLTDEDAKRRGR